MKIYYLLSSFCISLLIYGQSDFEIQKEIKNNNTIAYTLFNRLTRDQENLVCSPYSLRSCFAMVYPGVNGTSKEEIERSFMFVPKPEKQLEIWNADYKAMKDAGTNMFNSVWVHHDAKVRPPYLQLIRKYTGDSVMKLSNAQDVNSWVELRSSGNIKELVEDSDLQDIKVLLISCITFEDKWQTPFPTVNTKSRTFYTGKDSIDVATMEVNINARGLKNNAVEIVQLPYKGNMALTIMMPAKGKSFEVVEAYCDPEFLKLNENDLDEYHVADKNKLAYDQYDLLLPKFKIASKLELNKPLKEMGIIDSFYDTTADFSLMNAESDRWFISFVKQMANIEVDEEGTKASAATAVGVSFRSVSVPLHINRPFVYVLHDKYTGSILFMGQVKKP